MFKVRDYVVHIDEHKVRRILQITNVYHRYYFQSKDYSFPDLLCFSDCDEVNVNKLARYLMEL